jgi:disulfide bond formation protein DsbB
MFINIIKQLSNISHSRGYWLLYIIGSLCMLAAALYFQFIRELPPCLLCIQVRLLFSLLIIVSIIGLLSQNIRALNAIAHLSVVIIAVSFIERSYQLLGTERGFVFSDCGFNLGLPAWFAIDEWLPWLYRVETTCGYTPELLFGITMAEALMVMSVLLFLVSFCVTIASFIRPFIRH